MKVRIEIDIKGKPTQHLDHDLPDDLSPEHVRSTMAASAQAILDLRAASAPIPSVSVKL